MDVKLFILILAACSVKFTQGTDELPSVFGNGALPGGGKRGEAWEALQRGCSACLGSLGHVETGRSRGIKHQMKAIEDRLGALIPRAFQLTKLSGEERSCLNSEWVSVQEVAANAMKRVRSCAQQGSESGQSDTSGVSESSELEAPLALESVLRKALTVAGHCLGDLDPANKLSGTVSCLRDLSSAVLPALERFARAAYQRLQTEETLLAACAAEASSAFCPRVLSVLEGVLRCFQIDNGEDATEGTEALSDETTTVDK